MRIGRYEVVLVRVDANVTKGSSSSSVQQHQQGSHFDEMIVGNVLYALAEPGGEYAVRINVYRDEDGQFRPARIRIGLYIDGEDVNYWKRIDLSEEGLLPQDKFSPVSATFWGFKKNSDDMRSFVFSTPTVVSELSDIPALIVPKAALGTIKVCEYPQQQYSNTNPTPPNPIPNHIPYPLTLTLSLPK